MDFIILSALIIEIAVLSWLEYRATGTRITPFGVLAFPYLAVVILAFFLGPALDFASLHTGSLIVWMCGLLMVWVVGYLAVRIVPGVEMFRYLSLSFKSRFESESTSENLSKWLAMLAIPILTLGLLQSVRAVGGWSGVTSPEFKTAYSRGFPAHALVFCVPLFILLVGTAKKKTKFQLFLAGILMIFFLLGQVKGTVLQPLFGGFFYRVLRGRSSVSAESVSIVMLCGISIFVLIYFDYMSIADPSLASNPDTYSFLARHFYYYLMAGVLGFSEAFGAGTSDFGGSATEVFGPFLNLYRTLTGSGKLVTPSSSHGKGMQIDLTEESVDLNTNVYTFFGTLYLYLGVLGALIYVTVAGFICYVLFLAAGWTRNEWILVLYCFISAQLAFGFFELYFWYLNIYEIAVYTTIFAAFSIFAKEHRKAKPSAQLGTELFARP